LALAAIVCGTSLLLILEEATGRIATHGWLSASWIACLIAGVIWRYATRCHYSDVIDMDTVSLLRRSIRQARKDLFLARCLYAGVPCGALGGFLLMQLTLRHTSALTLVTDPTIRLIQAAAGIAALLAMMITGAVLARSRRQLARKLGENLRSLEIDL
jgi:hypothetical protein